MQLFCTFGTFLLFLHVLHFCLHFFFAFLHFLSFFCAFLKGAFLSFLVACCPCPSRCLIFLLKKKRTMRVSYILIFKLSSSLSEVKCTNLSRNQRLCSEVLSDSGVLYEALQFVLQIRCVFIEGYPFPCPCLGPKNVLNTTTQPGTSHFSPESVVSAWVPACLSGISQGGAGPAGVCSHSSGGGGCAERIFYTFRI